MELIIIIITATTTTTTTIQTDREVLANRPDIIIKT
jgi:hypothetical protein